MTQIKESLKKNNKFPSESIFDFVESELLYDAQLLICEDFGTEWGDYISINDSEISFYHCKYGEQSLSASKLQEVFGQVQKNLGFIDLTEELIDQRINKWLAPYIGVKESSRIRLGKKNEGEIRKAITKASNNPHTQKKVFAVLNFISKKELLTNIVRLQKNETFKNRDVAVQILWFVNSILSVAIQRSVRFQIICRP